MLESVRVSNQQKKLDSYSIARPTGSTSHRFQDPFLITMGYNGLEITDFAVQTLFNQRSRERHRSEFSAMDYCHSSVRALLVANKDLSSIKLRMLTVRHYQAISELSY